MKSFILSALSLGLVLSVHSFAAESGSVKPDILNPYLTIQESLASDSLTGITDAASLIEKTAKDKKIKASALALSKDTDLKSARKYFKALSVSMDQWAKVEKPEGIDRVYCSMADGHWLQKHGAIRNPYYGKRMEECGEVQK